MLLNVKWPKMDCLLAECVVTTFPICDMQFKLYLFNNDRNVQIAFFVSKPRNVPVNESILKNKNFNKIILPRNNHLMEPSAFRVVCHDSRSRL